MVDLKGNKVEGRYNPSSDTPTHMVLYNRFPEVGGIVPVSYTHLDVYKRQGICSCNSYEYDTKDIGMRCY